MSVRRNLLHRTASAVGLALIGVIALGCSGSGDSAPSSVPTTAASTTSVAPDTSPPPSVPMFGDLPSPCGPATAEGVPAVAEGQNGSERLALGVANDAGFPDSDRPTVEMLDAAQAFARWCNDQGGIRGLEIDIVDLDAQMSGVPLAMERACAEVFALVGGGWTFDDQMFPRFHECGMVSFPAYSVTAAASKSNGRVQAVPNPIDLEAKIWLEWVEQTYGDAVDDIAIIHADMIPIGLRAERLAAAMDVVGGFGDPILIGFDSSGPTAWDDIVRQLVEAGVTSVYFLGDVSQLVEFSGALSTIGFEPEVVFGDGDLMSDIAAAVLTEMPAGVEVLDSLRIRSVHPPLDEADSSPAVSSFLEMMSALDPVGRLAGLGVQTASAMLLFVTAANACLDANGSTLERECVLSQAKSISQWTAGGLHAETNPGSDLPPKCIVVLGIQAGRWSRLAPELGSSDDDGRGFLCSDEEPAVIEGDFGDARSGIDPSRAN